MTLEEKIMSEMKPAMIAKNEGALRGLRAIKGAIILAKTEKGSDGTVTSETEIKILQKLAKQRKESIEIFQKENRDDLVKKEMEELAVIEKFLPDQMSTDELKEIIKTIIAQVGASTPQDMGKVMGVASKQLAGKSDGKSISEMVKHLLSGS